MRPSPPFPARLVRAMAACTRTLAGADHAEAALARSGAATVGGLRAFADRLAARARFHDAAVHAHHAPADPAAAAVFEALEQARLDALGAGWLPGIARNLVSHPGTGEDALRWLAFEAMSAMAAPPERRDAAERLRRTLPAPLLHGLTDVAGAAADHERFAAAAAAWAQRAALHIPLSGPVSNALPFAMPIRQMDRWQRRGRYAAASTRATDRDQASSGDEAGAGPGVERAALDAATTEATYRVYTTAHDRVVNASQLASRDELERLRATLDAELAGVRSLVARLAKRLMRTLMARQVREWRFDLEEGLLDPSRLGPLVASGRARPFKQEMDSPFPSTVVTLLIDHSGSMRGRPMQIAALTVEIFARVLERCGVKCEVLGFTTREWDGGEPGRQWAAAGYPEQPGRLNALEHIIIKSADVPWRRARAALGLFMRDEMLKENVDGEALAWAHRRLLARTEQRRILIVVSDGTPMDEATLAANGYDYLDRHLQTVIDAIETRSPIQLAAIGIGHDVSRFYGNATRIARIDDLGPALTTKLLSLLADG